MTDPKSGQNHATQGIKIDFDVPRLGQISRCRSRPVAADLTLGDRPRPSRKQRLGPEYSQHLGAGRMSSTAEPVIERAGTRFRSASAAVAALGIVYGDIGTSPLYAFKQAASATGTLTPDAVIGVLSLMFWALILVVSAKYAILILRADN